MTPFDPSLSTEALLALQRLQVEVRLGSRVTDCDENGVAIGSELIEARTIVWAAGVKASPAGNWLRASTDPAGRVQVETNLSVPGHPNIFVLGDTASVIGRNGKPLPGGGAGSEATRSIRRGLLLSRAEKRLDPAPFHYRDFGSLATIGRNFAIMEWGKFKISGFFAWVLWGAAHIYFLIGFRNRLVVTLSWLWNYTTFRRGTRLITGLLDSHRDNPSPPNSSQQSGPT